MTVAPESMGDVESNHKEEPAFGRVPGKVTVLPSGQVFYVPPKGRVEIPMPMDPQEVFWRNIFDSCPSKMFQSGVGGFVVGGGFGLFMASMEVGMPAGGTTVHQTVKEMMQSTGKRMLSTAKSFGSIGFLFAGSECLIETYRAKNDRANSILAGCATGGIVGLRAGIPAALGGCATFAAFSAVIDHFIKG